MKIQINPLNAKLNPIYHLLALLGAHHILHVSRIRVKTQYIKMTSLYTTEPWLIAIFTALEYTAMSWISRTLCSRFTPRGCRVSIPHSPATALISHQDLCFIKMRLSAFMLYGMWLSFNHLTHFMLPESVYILLQRDCHNVCVSEVILYFSY